MAEELDLSLLEVRNILASVGAGGVIEEFEDGFAAIQPSHLRPVLVREVFFCGSVRPDFRDFVEKSPNQVASLHVLMNAAQRGANVPLSYIESQIARLDKDDLWTHFGWINETCANTILTSYPEKVVVAAEGLLHFKPHTTIRELILGSFRANTSTNTKDIFVNAIADWFCPPILEDLRDTVARRALVLDCLEALNDKGISGTGRSISWFLKEILDPAFSSNTTTPGDSRSIQLRQGVLSMSALQGIAAFWPRMRKLVLQIGPSDWRFIFEALHGWIWPSSHTMGRPVPDSLLAFMQATAIGILKDIVGLPNCGRVAKVEARRLSKAAGQQVDIVCDQLTEALLEDAYTNCHIDWKTREKRRDKILQLHAERLLTKPRKEVITDLCALENELGRFWVGF